MEVGVGISSALIEVGVTGQENPAVPKFARCRLSREATLQIGKDGWVTVGRKSPSPNFDCRPDGGEVRMVVIHNISLPPDEFGGPGVEQLFTNCLNPDEHPYYRQIAGLRVSAHFFIRRDGELVQFVSAEERAWHAGASCWRGRERCNDFSVGVELEGCDSMPFESGQYDCLIGLIAALVERYPIQDIVGHSDIAPGRKTDPGPFFDWGVLRDAGFPGVRPD